VFNSTYECTSASYQSFYNGPNRQDPGLVPDGAACGTEKVCIMTESVYVRNSGVLMSSFFLRYKIYFSSNFEPTIVMPDQYAVLI